MNVLILEDLPATADWIAARVTCVYENASISTAGSIAEAKKHIKAQAFDLALLDINLPDGIAIPFIADYKKTMPLGVAVLVSIYDDDNYVFDAICAGADGYLLKSLTEVRFEKKLLDISYGDPPLSPSVARKILRHSQETLKNSGTEQQKSGLTAREIEVLTLLSKGLSRVEIADLLRLSQSTIAKHIKTIYRKLEINSRAEAAVAACRLGLVSFETTH